VDEQNDREITSTRLGLKIQQQISIHFQAMAPADDAAPAPASAAAAAANSVAFNFRSVGLLPHSIIGLLNAQEAS